MNPTSAGSGDKPEKFGKIRLPTHSDSEESAAMEKRIQLELRGRPPKEVREEVIYFRKAFHPHLVVAVIRSIGG